MLFQSTSQLSNFELCAGVIGFWAIQFSGKL